MSKKVLFLTLFKSTIYEIIYEFKLSTKVKMKESLALMQGKNLDFFLRVLGRNQENGWLIKPEPFNGKEKNIETKILKQVQGKKKPFEFSNGFLIYNLV